MKPEMTDAGTVAWLVNETFRRSRQLIDQVVREQGITATQLGILKRIERVPGMSRAEMARGASISPQAAQVALTTLEKKGLVTRDSKSPGSRAVSTHLTPKGRHVLDACTVATEPVLEKLVAPLDRADRRTLIDLLTRCLEEEGAPD